MGLRSLRWGRSDGTFFLSRMIDVQMGKGRGFFGGILGKVDDGTAA